MHDGRFPVELIRGVPVAAAPDEIDVTNAPELRSALLQAVAAGHGTLVAALARTSPSGSNGHRRPDDRPEGGAAKTTGTAAQHGIGGPGGEAC